MSSMRETFGILPTLFWEGDVGRAIQARGKDAVILAEYLRANRHSTMLGYYRVRLDDILHEMPVLGSLDAIRQAFSALREVGWADYDEPSACVWVRDMARLRVNLKEGALIDPEDGRKVVLQRLYESLPPNALLEPFFETYGRVLRLKRRTFAQPVLEDLTARGAGEGAGRGAPPGGVRAGTSTTVRGPDQDDQEKQDQEKPRTSGRTATAVPSPLLPPVIVSSRLKDAASRAPNGSNFHIIQKVAWDLITDPTLARKYLEVPIETESDLVDATKNFCGKHRIEYGRRDVVPFDVVHRACAAVWAKAKLGLKRDAGPRPRGDGRVR
jgi:hypothetical protein